MWFREDVVRRYVCKSPEEINRLSYFFRFRWFICNRGYLLSCSFTATHEIFSYKDPLRLRKTFTPIVVIIWNYASFSDHACLPSGDSFDGLDSCSHSPSVSGCLGLWHVPGGPISWNARDPAQSLSLCFCLGREERFWKFRWNTLESFQTLRLISFSLSGILFFSLIDPRYPSISQDVFVVNPTEGFLEANSSFTSQTKTTLKVTFTSK